MASYKGKFKPKNPSKYVGDPNNIIYRSLWELKCMRKWDTDKNVLKWASEELIIPYKNPVKKKIARYFPDFVIEYINTSGEKEIAVIEVKPYKQTIPPILKEGKKPSNRRYKKEVITYAINKRKWEAAEKYCKDKNWKFIILTEHEINPKKGK